MAAILFFFYQHELFQLRPELETKGILMKFQNTDIRFFLGDEGTKLKL